MNRHYQMRILFIFLLIIGLVNTKPPHYRERGIESSERMQRYPSQYSKQMDSSNSYQSHMNNNLKNKDKPKSQLLLWVLLFLLCLLTFAYMKKRQIWIIKDIFLKQMNKFQQSALAKPLKSSDKQKQARILAIKDKKYIITSKFADPLLNFKTEMTLSKIQKVKDRLYQIKYECKDINGTSSCQGLAALLNTKEISLKFIKIYSKYTHMGEKVKKQKRLIFFEGKGPMQCIIGKWYYYGFQNEQNQYGEFEMS